MGCSLCAWSSLHGCCLGSGTEFCGSLLHLAVLDLSTCNVLWCAAAAAAAADEASACTLVPRRKTAIKGCACCFAFSPSGLHLAWVDSDHNGMLAEPELLVAVMTAERRELDLQGFPVAGIRWGDDGCSLSLAPEHLCLTPKSPDICHQIITFMGL